MKQKLTTYLSIILLCSMLTSCSTSLMVPVAVTDNPVGTRRGVAMSKTFFGIGDVDVGVEKAAKNGKITRIATVDYKVTVQFGFIAKYETIVTGTGPGDEGVTDEVGTDESSDDEE
jgi:hypothetical protein